MMTRYPRIVGPWLLILVLIALLVWAAGYAARKLWSRPTATVTSASIATATAVPIATLTPTSTNTSVLTQTPAATLTPGGPSIPPEPIRADEMQSMLPEAFYYEITLRPAGVPGAPETIIAGAYHSGAWQQTMHNEAGPGQESITVSDTTYTRPSGEAVWTRWPSVGFDAAYGPTSPFTALRLYRLADQTVRGGLSLVPGAPEATFRVQAVVSAETVKRLLEAGATALATDAETRSALIAQVTPLAAPQTITYWVGEDGNIYRAAATILATDERGQATPWLEAIWRFWGYNDPAIAVSAPVEYRDAPGPSASAGEAHFAEPLPTTPPQPTPAEGFNLIVHVFQSPGVPAQDLSVTVYPAGNTRQPLDWRDEPEAEFVLPPGRYDVLVQMDYTQEWLRNVEVIDDTLTTRKVTFDFGILQLTVTRSNEVIPVDIVTYPTGDRQNWVDWRSDNPATIRLRAGTYDVEIAYDDYKATATVQGLVVRAGETTEKTVALRP